MNFTPKDKARLERLEELMDEMRIRAAEEKARKETWAKVRHFAWEATKSIVIPTVIMLIGFWLKGN